MTKEQVEKYLDNKGMDPKERVKRDNGGQFLSNFLVEFARDVKNKTLNDVVTEIKKRREL